MMLRDKKINIAIQADLKYYNKRLKELPLTKEDKDALIAKFLLNQVLKDISYNRDNVCITVNQL